jgi:hypothetical protein
MAKDFWRIESVDPVANMIVVQNLNGLVDRLRAAGEAFTITTDGAVAVEADETLIRKCAWSISSARVYAYRPRNANRQPQCQWSRYHVTEGRMVQASVLRAVMNGKVPSHHMDEYGQLPFNLLKTESLVWVFPYCDYYEDKIRTQRVGAYQGVVCGS